MRPFAVPAPLAGAVLLAVLTAGGPAPASVPDAPTVVVSPPVIVPAIEVRVETGPAGIVVVAEGVPGAGAAQVFDLATWRRVFRVVARDPERSPAGVPLPPLLGSYGVEAGALRFRPRFPVAPGLRIEADFDPAAWNAATGAQLAGGPVRAGHGVAGRDLEATTRVAAVYPATGSVPENLLRFYVHFTAPMAAHHVLPHVVLLDDGGEVIDPAFVEVEGGLWDPQRTRLTLFVHPGRVKRGVGPNQVLGPVLEAGKTYRLRIGAAARDARGAPLAAAHEHAFAAGPADHTSPDPASWILEPPATPDEPLGVELRESADVALLQRLPTVVGADGGLIQGRIDVAPDGARFAFHPDAPWRPGAYQLKVPPSLEDAAGNRVDRRFEEAPGDAGEPARGSITRPFTVGEDGSQPPVSRPP